MIPIPADIAEPIWEAAKKEPALSFKKWVHPHDYHIGYGVIIKRISGEENPVRSL
jgi:hypothetical protein